ncbi:hypothetical protein ACFRFH_15455 [Leifsonia sp. NPDC056824]|uniref:hypothetical protein n=1 Tax=Leifsonia sp. NPDC056824 TaxID=3345953 RepID=UPI0036A92EA8
MRLRSVLQWTPSVLFVLLVGVGILLMTLEFDNTTTTLLVGELDGAQLGLTLLLVAAAVTVVLLGQLMVVVERVPWRWARVLTRVAAVAVWIALIPVALAMLYVLGWASSVEYVHLDVPGRDLAAYRSSASETIGLMERRGLFYERVHCPPLEAALQDDLAMGHRGTPGWPRWDEFDLQQCR